MRHISRIAVAAQRQSSTTLISALIAVLFTVDLFARHAIGA